MTIFYLKISDNFTSNDAKRLNDILYFHYVTEDGENFKFPYDSKTKQFINWQQDLFTIGDAVINSATDNNISAEDRSFISSALAFKKTEEEAVSAGWINNSLSLGAV